MLIASSSVAIALAVTLWVWTILSASHSELSPRSDPDSLVSYEQNLRDRIAATDPIYSRLARIVEELAAILRAQVSPDFLQKFGHALDVCSLSPPWSSAQYLASKTVEGTVGGLVVGGISFLGSRSIVASGMLLFIITAFYLFFAVWSVLDRADVRTLRVRSRLPFATDLMALVLQAGGTPVDAFAVAVRENAGHPLGEELQTVAIETSRGRPRVEALRTLRERFPDPDVSDFVFAIVKGEELGTPLAQVLKMQAEQMRLKNSQWCEKQAAEAEVKIAFPGLLVMLACICVILGPLLLPVIFGTK
jgi:tight adherence protein C